MCGLSGTHDVRGEELAMTHLGQAKLASQERKLFLLKMEEDLGGTEPVRTRR